MPTNPTAAKPASKATAKPAAKAPAPMPSPNPETATLQPFAIDDPAFGAVSLELSPTRLTVNGTTIQFGKDGLFARVAQPEPAAAPDEASFVCPQNRDGCTEACHAPGCP